MRVHLPAVFAFLSAAAYVACGASDPSIADQEDGGAGGEGGDGANAGGASNSAAGAQNGGGSKSNPGGGEGGLVEIGGAATAGAGGAGLGGDSGMLGGAAGAGGAGEPLDENAFPSECGVVGDYLTQDGTTGPDTFTSVQLGMNNSKVFARGLEGDDVFEFNNEGQDCLVGGAGDDELSAPGEFASILFGGSGADLFHLRYTSNNGPSVILDMTSEDTIGILKTTFNFLAGDPGATPLDTQVMALAGYEAGTTAIPNGEGAVLVYDPETGGLWLDVDRGMKDLDDTGQLISIANFGDYVFDINDFVIE